MKLRQPRVEVFSETIYIDGAVLQTETGDSRVIEGKIFDIADASRFGKSLSSIDSQFYRQVKEFNISPESQLTEFIEYMMHARMLIPFPAYGSVAYYPKGAQRKPKNAAIYFTNHGTEGVLFGIQSGLWNPSDALEDLVVLAKIMPEGKKLFQEARKLILAGYNVNIKGAR